MRARAWLRAIGVSTAFVLVVAAAISPIAIDHADDWQHVRFASPLWLLLLVPALASLARITWMGDPWLPRLRVSSLFGLRRAPRGRRTWLRDAPGVLRAAALAVGVLALARPQDVIRGERAAESGIDIVVLLDLSGSMRAIMDSPTPAPPTRGGRRPTRLDTAKTVIIDFVNRRHSDRIGVVVFGKAAYVLSPPTLDYSLLTNLVSKMSLDLIDGDGTAIGDAVGTGVARLRRSQAASKAVILLTDGDSNSGSISPSYGAHLAKTHGVRIYTVQIGNGDDVEIEKGTDLFGQPQYVRAKFPVNPELLRELATTTGGESFVATDRHSLEESMHAILDSLEKTRFEAHAATMEDLFPPLLAAAVLLVALELLLRATWLRRAP